MTSQFTWTSTETNKTENTMKKDDKIKRGIIKVRNKCSTITLVLWWGKYFNWYGLYDTVTVVNVWEINLPSVQDFNKSKY